MRKEVFFAKKEWKFIIIFCQKFFIESPLTILCFVTRVTKFVLANIGIIIDVIEPFSAIKSIDLSTNLAAIRMQRLPPELTAHKLGVTSLTDWLESLVLLLAICFWASVLTSDTMAYMILLFQQNRADSVKFLVFDLL